MPNGYAIYGRDPVFADVDAYLDAEADAEARGEFVDSYINDAVDELLFAGDDRDLLVVLQSESGNMSRRVDLPLIYDTRTGDCSADSNDEWTRVMLLCKPEHLPMLRQQWLDWCRGMAAEYSEVLIVAERLAAAAEQDAADDLAQQRAEMRAGL